MKIVYRSMLKEIERAVETAANNNRTIEHIELTPTEYSELAREAAPHIVGSYELGVTPVDLVHGVVIKRAPREPAR